MKILITVFLFIKNYNYYWISMIKPINVVHLVGGELSAGAARGAYWLHKGLLALGVESSILTNAKVPSSDIHVKSTANGRLAKAKLIVANQLELNTTSFYRGGEGPIFSTNLFGGKVSDHPLVRAADIVNMHWIARGPIGLSDIRRIKVPVVWTMRDMWPFTGGCHYSLDCDGYRAGCGKCPQLFSKRTHDLSRVLAWKKKQKLPTKLVAVGISHWLSEQARQSSILEQEEVRTIHNCIDTEDFFSIEKSIARAALGLESKKPIVLVGSTNLQDFYKGFELFIKAANQFSSEDFLILSFGSSSEKWKQKIKQEVKELGFLSDSLSLRMAYNAADVFVAPSIMEAFGKTLVESMACGTPVVCFDATGPKDIVSHKINGYKAQPFNVTDLAAGISFVLQQKDARSGSLNSAARESAVKLFDKKVIAEKYLDLYKELL
jgi:glycosyltransferase involved in cell wall biosynthesis